jgi:hypothetical protein
MDNDDLRARMHALAQQWRDQAQYFRDRSSLDDPLTVKAEAEVLDACARQLDEWADRGWPG